MICGTILTQQYALLHRDSVAGDAIILPLAWLASGSKLN